MSIYTRLQQTATRLLTNYGQQYSFTRYTQGAYDPGAGTSSPTTSSFTKYCVRDNYNLFEQTNTAVEQGDLLLIAENGTYQQGDTVNIDSETWRIMNAEPITPGATNVMYLLQVRK